MSPKKLKINGVEGADSLKNLKLEQVYIDSIDEILKCKSLKTLELENCTLKDKDGFIKNLQHKGINVIQTGVIAQGNNNPSR